MPSWRHPRRHQHEACGRRERTARSGPCDGLVPAGPIPGKPLRSLPARDGQLRRSCGSGPMAGRCGRAPPTASLERPGSITACTSARCRTDICSGSPEAGRRFSCAPTVPSPTGSSTRHLDAVEHPGRCVSGLDDFTRPPVVAATAQLMALDRQPLPAGYGFALVSREGRVLYHSDRRLSLRESFFEELSNGARARALMYAGGIRPHRGPLPRTSPRVLLAPGASLRGYGGPGPSTWRCFATRRSARPDRAHLRRGRWPVR